MARWPSRYADGGAASGAHCRQTGHKNIDATRPLMRPEVVAMAFQDKFFLDHLPKTGGTALRTVLEEMFGAENVSPHLEGRSETWAIQRYSRFRVISGHFLTHVPSDSRTGGRARVTVLRHP